MSLPVKTTEGQAELSSRRRGLSQRYRTLLLLVDGRRSVVQVQSLAAQAGVPVSCFDELLVLGLIELREPLLRPAPSPNLPAPFTVDLLLDSLASGADSVLPASQTMAPESVLGELPAPDSAWRDAVAPGGDAALEEARELLLRAVRAEAPVAGTLTLLKLRRARNRAELAQLLGEVEARISKPYKALVAAQTLARARQLLAAAGSGGDSTT